jgi:hypothetical protein
MTSAHMSGAVGTFLCLPWAHLISELKDVPDFHREDMEFGLDCLVQQTYTSWVFTQPFRRVSRRYFVSCEQQ